MTTANNRQIDSQFFFCFDAIFYITSRFPVSYCTCCFKQSQSYLFLEAKFSFHTVKTYSVQEADWNILNFLEIFWPSHWRALWRSGYMIQRCVTIYTPKAKLKVVWFSQNIFNKKPIHVHFKLDFSVHFPSHLFLGRTCHKRINIDKLNKESKSTCEFHTHREVLGNLHKLQYICEKIRSDSHKLVWMKSFLVTL